MIRKILTLVVFLYLACSSAFAQTTFQLTSGTTGTLPFSVGVAFKKGDAPAFATTNATTSQVVIKRRWNDNSIKHAIISGTQALTSGVPTTITISTSGSDPGGTPLTCADIATAAPTASIQAGSIGTIGLSSLLASPFRTWITGPEMVECHYRSQIGSDTSLVAQFHVRLWSNGRIWVRATVENGYLDAATVDKSYVPTVVINGVTVYNNGGSPLAHNAYTRWTVDGWVGTDPQITPKLNTTYLMSTKLVPNYWKLNPSAAALNALTQTYVPMGLGGVDAQTNGGGFHMGIGLLPHTDSLYVSSAGDARAFRAVLAYAKGVNSHGIIHNDSVTGDIVLPTNRPTSFVAVNGGPGSTGGYVEITGGNLWDIAHHPMTGYLAYLITGDYYHLETLEHTAASVYLMGYSNGVPGDGTSRILLSQTRVVAWSARTLGLLSAIGPTSDPIVADYRALLTTQVNYWNTRRQVAGQNQLGILYAYETYGPTTPELGYDVSTAGRGISAFMQHFWTATYGWISDLDPLTDMTALIAVRDHMYKVSVGLLGPSGTSNFCFNNAASYVLVVMQTPVANPLWETTAFYDTWGEVFTQTFTGTLVSVPNNSCGNTLQGNPGGIPSGQDPAAGPTGNWANLQPGIAYAVEHGAPGALEAWNRFTGASNFSTYENAATGLIGNGDFNDIPIWGIIPRSTFPLGWTELTNTKIKTVGIAPPNGFGGSPYAFFDNVAGHINGWGSAVFDSLRNRFVTWGGGHGDYGGNELYALDLDTQTLSRITDPAVPVSTSFEGATDPEALAGGTQPNARHTYDILEYMAAHDKMFSHGGGLAFGGGGSTATWLFNFGTNSWEGPVSTTGTKPKEGILGYTAGYSPAVDKVFIHADFDLWSYTPTTATYAKLTANGTGYTGNFHMTGVVDPVRERFFIIGGGDAWWYDISSGSSYVRQNLSMTGAAGLLSANYPGLAYHTPSGKIVGWNGFDTIYLLDTQALTWTTQTFAGGPTPNITDAGAGYAMTLGRFRYSDASGVFVVVNYADANMYVLRISADEPDCTPDHLTFTSQPSSAITGASLGTVSVAIVDAGGSTCTNETTSITLSKNGSSTWGTLNSGSSLTKAAVSGVATWTDLSVTGATGSGPINAAASGLTGVTSNSFVISAPTSPTAASSRVRFRLPELN